MSKELTPLEALNILVGMAVVQQMAYKMKPIIENALKTNKRKLDLIGEILVDVSKGNYADLNTAIDEIREVLL